MVTKIDVTNVNGTFTIKLIGSENTLLPVTNIDGLGPADGTVNITDKAAMNGGSVTSTRITSRNLVITMYLSDPKKSRRLFYKIFPLENNLTLRLYTDDDRTYTIDGVVETTTVDYFGDTEGAQVSIICPDPYFYDVNDSYLKMSNSATDTASGTSDGNETYTRLWGIDTDNSVAYIKSTPSYIDKEYYQLVNKPTTYSEISKGDYVINTINSQLVAVVDGVGRSVYCVDSYVTIDHDDMFGGYDYFYESGDDYLKLDGYDEYDSNVPYKKRIMKYATPVATEKDYTAYIAYTTAAISALAARSIAIGTGGHACKMIWNDNTTSWTIKTPYMTFTANDGASDYGMTFTNTSGLTEVTQSNAEIVFTLDYDGGYKLSATYGSDAIASPDDLVNLRNGTGADWNNYTYYIKDQYDSAVYRVCYAYDPEIEYYTKITLTSDMDYYKYMSAGYHWEASGSEYNSTQIAARYAPATYKDVTITSLDENTKYYIHEKFTYTTTTDTTGDDLYAKNTSNTTKAIALSSALNDSYDTYTNTIVDDMVGDSITLIDSAISGSSETLSFRKYSSADSSTLYFKSSSSNSDTYANRHNSTYNMYPAFQQDKSYSYTQIGTDVTDSTFQSMCANTYDNDTSTNLTKTDEDEYLYKSTTANGSTTYSRAEIGSDKDIVPTTKYVFTTGTGTSANYVKSKATYDFVNPQIYVETSSKVANSYLAGSITNYSNAATFLASTLPTNTTGTPPIATDLTTLCRMQITDVTERKTHKEFYYANSESSITNAKASYDGVYRSTYILTDDTSWDSTINDTSVTYNKDYFSRDAQIDYLTPTHTDTNNTKTTTPIFSYIPHYAWNTNYSPCDHDVYERKNSCDKEKLVTVPTTLPKEGGTLTLTSDASPVSRKWYLKVFKILYEFTKEDDVDDAEELAEGITHYYIENGVLKVFNASNDNFSTSTKYYKQESNVTGTTIGTTTGYVNKIWATKVPGAAQYSIVYRGSTASSSTALSDIQVTNSDLTDGTLEWSDSIKDSYGYERVEVKGSNLNTSDLANVFDRSSLEFYEYYFRTEVDDYDVKLQNSSISMQVSQVVGGGTVLAKFAGIPIYNLVTGLTADTYDSAKHYICENGTYKLGTSFDSNATYYTKYQDDFTYIPYSSNIASAVYGYRATYVYGSDTVTRTYNSATTLAEINSELGITEARYPTAEEMNSLGIRALYVPAATAKLNPTFRKEFYLMPSISRLRMMLYDVVSSSYASTSSVGAYISSSYPYSSFISTILDYNTTTDYTPKLSGEDYTGITSYIYSNTFAYVTDANIFVRKTNYGDAYELVPFVASQPYYIYNGSAWVSITPTTTSNRDTLYHASYSGKMAYYRFTSATSVTDGTYLCTSNTFDIVTPYINISAANASQYSELYHIAYNTYTLAASYSADKTYAVPMTYTKAVSGTHYSYDEDEDAYVSSTVLYSLYPTENYYLYLGAIASMSTGTFFVLTEAISDQVYGDSQLFKLGNYAYMENTSGTNLYPKITITMNREENWKDLDIYVKDTTYNVLKHSKIDKTKFSLSSISIFDTQCNKNDKIVIDTQKRTIKYYKYSGSSYSTYNMLYAFTLVESNTPQYGKIYAYSTGWPDVPQGTYLLTVSTDMAITVEYSFKTGYEGL